MPGTGLQASRVKPAWSSVYPPPPVGQESAPAFIHVLQRRKLREVETLVQGHTAREWRGWDFMPHLGGTVALPLLPPTNSFFIKAIDSRAKQPQPENLLHKCQS